MKRYILTLITALTTMAGASAMNYQRAREEALYLTDKMAYELNLNDQQYNDAYEINLDYFLSMESESDLYADYLNYRLTDFRHILLNWQFDLMLRADYFVRPIIWSHGCWVFPIYRHYHRHVFYYDCPRVYYEYRGGHGHHHYHNGFYANRRPRWDGGMRGREPMGHINRYDRPMTPDREGGRVNPSRGNGYHFDLPGQGTRNPGRGESSMRGSEERPGRNENNMTPGREERTTIGSTYNRTTSGNYNRQGQTPVTRSENHTTTIPGRSISSGSRSSSGSSSYDRGNSFSRSSSRATSGGASAMSRGGSINRNSSSTQTKSSGTSTPSRRGTSGGSSVSRGGR
ncbi:MAG: hypothetical protein ACI4B5_06645 [Bacteroidaceae bacterium]